MQPVRSPLCHKSYDTPAACAIHLCIDFLTRDQITVVAGNLVEQCHRLDQSIIEPNQSQGSSDHYETKNEMLSYHCW